MNNTMPQAHELPHLAQVFELLRRGRHICAFDGAPYSVLVEHQEAFTSLFAALGFDLKAHHRDFFYFHTKAKPSESATRMALFVLILVEDQSNRGYDVEQSLLNEPFVLDDLPHLASDRHTRIMNEAGVHNQDDLERVIDKLDRFGFAHRSGRGVFTFRPPVCRFLDLCLDVLNEEEASS